LYAYYLRPVDGSEFLTVRLGLTGLHQAPRCKKPYVTLHLFVTN
jgi:hypothetical protein